MIKKYLKFTLMSVMSFMALTSHAADLFSVYQDAYVSDPAFKAAQADFQAVRQNIPLSISNFLPQVALNGSISRAYNSDEFQNPGLVGDPSLGHAEFYNNTTTYSLSATQSIFNFANWAKLSSANAQVKQAAAKLSAAAQDLMIRTSIAYFAVLRASEDLRFIQAEKRAIKIELDQSKDRFQVGLIAITAVYEAQARFDDVVAREIAAKNLYSNRIEELRQITGKSYRALLGVSDNIPLISPQPLNIDCWVKTAEKQNYSLQAARYGSEVARENIKIQFSGHLPVIEAQGSFDYNYQDNFNNAGAAKTKVATAALAGTLPVTNGGATIALTRQAQYLYQETLSQVEFTHRSVIAQTRNAFLGVLSAISQIRADKQAIVSSQSAFEATKASMEAGTRTMVDVLNAQSNLYRIQSVTVAAEYDYLLQTLLLKQTAGTLSPHDMMTINHCLSKRTVMITDADIMHTEIVPHTIPDQNTDLSQDPSEISYKRFYANPPEQGKGKGKGKGKAKTKSKPTPKKN